MKKVIRGSRYDTETARVLGRRTNGLLPGELEYVSETLYRTKAGKFFLHGEGGPKTAYSERTATGWKGGECITPIEVEQAQGWAEEHLDADEYEGIFGAVDEPNLIAVTVYVTPACRAKLDKLKKETGRSVSQIVERAVMGYEGA